MKGPQALADKEVRRIDVAAVNGIALGYGRSYALPKTVARRLSC